MTQKRKITNKQQRFCEEYLIDLNAAEAARRAGYSSKRADQIGYENLRKPELAALIRQLMAKRAERTRISADAVLQEIARIAFANMGDYVIEFGQKPMKLVRYEDIPSEKKAAIAEMTETTTKEGVNRRFKLHDKLKALDMLAKHLGLYEPNDGSRSETTAADLAEALKELTRCGYKPPNPIMKMPE